MVSPDDDLDRHVRRVDPDRWLSTRLIPDANARTEVLALYALDNELSRIAPAVSQPALGEIRLQWWREALDRAAQGGAADHPVIAVLQPALREGRLERDLLDALIASHEAELDPASSAEEGPPVSWFDERFGAAMCLAAGLLAPGVVGAPWTQAGRAWGWASLIRRGDAPPQARERVDAALRASRVELRSLPTPAFPAVAYAALARDLARGREPGALARRAKMLWAAARGAL